MTMTVNAAFKEGPMSSSDGFAIPWGLFIWRVILLSTAPTSARPRNSFDQRPEATRSAVYQDHPQAIRQCALRSKGCVTSSGKKI
jgi:hypothetical protein